MTLSPVNNYILCRRRPHSEKLREKPNQRNFRSVCEILCADKEKYLF